MNVSPLIRLLLLVTAGVLPVWQKFFSLSSDYTFRGLAAPLIESASIACVVVIARTRNALVDGDPQKVELSTPPGESLAVHEEKAAVKPVKPELKPK